MDMNPILSTQSIFLGLTEYQLRMGVMVIPLVPSIIIGMKQILHLTQYERTKYPTNKFRKLKMMLQLNNNLIYTNKGHVGYDP